MTTYKHKRVLIIIDEIWKDVTLETVKPDMYEVSNYGRVRNKFSQKIKRANYDKDGYRTTVLMRSDDKRCRPYRINRLVANEFCKGRTEERDIVNHIDGDKSWDMDYNLEWCTVAENTQHGYDMNLSHQGESHYRNKYPAMLITTICELIDRGLPNSEINSCVYTKFKDIEITRDLVKDVRRGKVWKSISMNYSFMKLKAQRLSKAR